jgi:hypothetical protein
MSEIKWIPADEMLPSESENVLTITKYSCMEPMVVVVHYSAKHKAFNVGDEDEYPRTAIQVTAWAHIPTEEEDK